MKRVELLFFIFLLLVLFKSSEQQMEESSDEIMETDYDLGNDYNSTSNNTEDNKIYLLGFGKFQRPIRQKITFRIYFKKVGIISIGNTLIFTIVINYSSRLRALEEKEETSTCHKIDETEDLINYDCEAPIDENKNFTVIESKGNYVTEQGKVEFEETTLSKNANIAEQTGNTLELESVELFDGILFQDEKTFTIEGVIEKPFYEKEVTLYFDDYDEKKEVVCTVSNISNIYNLSCTPQVTIIDANLENTLGIGKNQNILIHMKDKDEFLSIQPKGKPISNNFFSKKPNRGLSGGSIAAIVICCVAVVVAVIVTAVLLKKAPKKVTREDSNVEMISSATKII